MLKITGMLIVMFSSTLFGYVLKHNCHKRVKLLENMKSCLSIMENEIRYCQNDMEKTINKVLCFSEGSNSRMFRLFIDGIKTSDGESASEIWNKATEGIAGTSVYDADDIEVIKSFGNILGYGDIDTQLKNIDLFHIQIVSRLDVAKQKLKKHGELSGKLGIYIGILAVIIFW